MSFALIQQANSGLQLGPTLLIAAAVLGTIWIIKASISADAKLHQGKFSPEEQENFAKIKKPTDVDLEKGSINPAMICPHCQTKGTVRTKHVTQKQGISGGKATAALLTGGVSLVAVGLSKKGEVTKAHCDQCGNNWMF